MYPSRFHYHAPRSLAAALDLLQSYGDGAKVLAGGQSLIPMVKLRSPRRRCWSTSQHPGAGLPPEDADGSLRIGALCRHTDLEFSALAAGRRPTMAAAAPLIADPIVRNRGTLVGSLCHADPQGDWASVMLALGGEVIAVSVAGRRTIPMSRVRGRAVPEHVAARGDRGRGQSAGDTGHGVRRLLKLERRVGDFATVGVAVAIETDGGRVRRPESR